MKPIFVVMREWAVEKRCSSEILKKVVEIERTSKIFTGQAALPPLVKHSEFFFVADMYRPTWRHGIQREISVWKPNLKVFAGKRWIISSGVYMDKCLRHEIALIVRKTPNTGFQEHITAAMPMNCYYAVVRATIKHKKLERVSAAMAFDKCRFYFSNEVSIHE